MIIDPKEHHYKEIYKLMIGSIVPRPIAFVSTVSPMSAGLSITTSRCHKSVSILFATSWFRPASTRRESMSPRMAKPRHRTTPPTASRSSAVSA